MHEVSLALLAALLLAAFSASPAHAWELSQGDASLRPSLEAGYQPSASLKQSELTRSRLYAQPALEANIGKSTETPITLLASARGWIETQDLGPGPGHGLAINGEKEEWSGELSVRALSASLSHGVFKGTLGFQEISWGETFGFPVVDVVNPRDFSDPLIQDPAWIKLPVAAVQAQVFLDRLTLQGILTPLPRGNILPYPGTRFDPTQKIVGVTLREQPSREVTETPEFGGRISYLFESGIDLGFLYYRHWNRNPVFEAAALPIASSALTVAPSIELTPVAEPVQSYGMTLSSALGPVVLRADGALTVDQPLAGGKLGEVERGARSAQGAVGADYTSDQDFTLGVQYQNESQWLRASTRQYHWVSARAMQKLFRDQLEPELFVFRGLRNSDLWVQPKLTWNFASAWSASLRFDLIEAAHGDPTDGYLWMVEDQSRALLWITLKI